MQLLDSPAVAVQPLLNIVAEYHAPRFIFLFLSRLDASVYGNVLFHFVQVIPRGLPKLPEHVRRLQVITASHASEGESQEELRWRDMHAARADRVDRASSDLSCDHTLGSINEVQEVR